MDSQPEKGHEFPARWVQGLSPRPATEPWKFAARDEVHVWCADLIADEASLTRARHLLSPEEEARVERMVTPELQARQTLSYAMVRMLLARYLGEDPGEVRFAHSATGKPQLADAPDRLHFNVSHCETAALYAFAPHANVGVDIERKRTLHNMSGMFSTILTDAERAIVEKLSADDRQTVFFDAWTIKEACLKATGEGIAGLQHMEAVLGLEDSAPVLGLRVEAGTAAKDWFVGRLPLDAEHVAAVAVTAGCSECLVFRGAISF